MDGMRNEKYYFLDANRKVKFVCSMRANANDYANKHPEMMQVMATSEREAIQIAKESAKYGEDES